MAKTFKKHELKEQARRCLTCFYDGYPITTLACKKCLNGDKPDGWKPKK